MQEEERQGTLTPSGMHFGEFAHQSSRPDLSASQAQRHQSASTSQLNRFMNHSANLSHIATLQRKPRKPIVCGPLRSQPPPPPLPPKEFVSPPFSHSASAFDLHRIVDNRRPSTHSLHPSWQQSHEFSDQRRSVWEDVSSPQPYCNQFDSGQQQRMAVFDQPNHPQLMHRTSSSSSMNSMNQPIFNPWSSFSSPHRPQDFHAQRAAGHNQHHFETMEFKRSRSPNLPAYSNNFRSNEDHFLAHQSSQQRNTPSPPPRPPPVKVQQRKDSAKQQPGFEDRNRVNRPVSPPAANATAFASRRASQVRESPLQRQPSPGSWQCEFCTLINSKEDKICTVCCKTPSSMLEASNLSLDSIHLSPDDHPSASHQHEKKKSKGRPGPEFKTPKSPPPSPKQSTRREHKQAGQTPSRVHSDGSKTHNHHQDKLPAKSTKQHREPSEEETSDDEQDLDQDEEEEEEDSSSSGIPPANIFPQTPVSSAESDFEFPLQIIKTSRQRKPKLVTQSNSSQDLSSSEEAYASAHPQPKLNKTYKFKPEQKVSAAAGKGLSKRIVSVPDRATLTARGAPSPENSSHESTKSATIKSVLKKAIPVKTPVQTFNTDIGAGSLVQESKGTSPPPQSISTQTYEELSLSAEIFASESQNMASTCSSVGPASSSENMFDPPSPRKPKEMSDKELRYSRKAQQQSKLKRSMSTHLTGNEDPWTEAFEPRNIWRSSSRHSLANDLWSLPFSGPPSRDPSPPPRGSRQFPNFQNFQLPSWERFSASPADYFASLENSLSNNRRRWGETPRQQQETELSYLLKEGAEYGFSPEELQIALRMSGNENPIKWLKENWQNMIETVQTLATNYGRDKGEYNNDVGTISTNEARESLRGHKGNVWASITSCVEHRRANFKALQTRGNFLREEILTALTINHGNLDAAFVDLSKAQLKPFLMHVWGPPMQPDNEATPSLAGSTSSAGSRGSAVPPPVQNTAFGPLQPFSDFPHPSPPPQVLEIHPDEEESDEEQSNTNCNQPMQIVDNQLQLSMQVVLELLETQRNKLLQEKASVSSSSDTSSSVRAAQTPQSSVVNLDTVVGPAILNAAPIPSNLPLKQDSETPAADNVRHQYTGPSLVTNTHIFQAPKTPPLQSNTVEQLRPAPQVIAPPERVIPVETGNSVALMSTVQTEKRLANYGATELRAAGALMSGLLQELVRQSSTGQNQPHAGSHFELAAGASNVPAVLQTEQLKLSTGSSPTAVAASPLQFAHSITETFVPTIPAPVTVVSSGAKNNKKMVPALITSALTSVTNQQMSAGDSGNVTSVAVVTARASEPSMTSDLRQIELEYQETEGREHQTQVLEAVSDFRQEPSQLHEGDSSEEIEDYVDDVFGDEDEDDDEFDSQASQHNSQEIGSESCSDEFEDDITAKYRTLEHTTETSVTVIRDYPEANVLKESQPKDLVIPAQAQVLPPARELKPAVKRLLDLGLSESFETAELAAQLMEMKFTEEDSVIASKECSSLNSALSYLHQECHLCAGKYSAHQMVSMLRCTHWCCRTCAKDYFVLQIRDRGILDATCPFCKEPANLLEDPDAAAEYFNHLDIMLKNLIDSKYHEMFQRKLRDWALSKTPNFKWCSKCSSGFITEPLQTRLVCPDCSAVTCAVCLEPWTRTHDHPDQKEVKLCDATRSVVDYLNENSIECPRCMTKFALARGGCMHLTCSTCKFEFCSGCSAPFKHADKCNKGPFCLKLGLHAHHPRNCLFYLRDKDPPFLTKLLQDSEVPYLSEGSQCPEPGNDRKCIVSVQRETQDGLQDDTCGSDAPLGFASVCRAHYVEYLGLLIWQNHLDPVSILSNDDLETIIRRAHKKCPPRPYGTKDADYRLKLLEVIQQEIPL